MAELFKLEPASDTPTQPQQSTADQVGFHLLRLGLKALSQRALVALSACFTLLTVASAFWLYMSIRDPNNMQLVEIGMYSLFVLAANIIVKKV